MNELLPMITERDSAPMVASFKECKAGAIYIKNEKLERR